MKISVVTSSYNNENEIVSLYESLLDQGIYEWIVIDDGSTDDTWKIIKQLSSANPGFNIEGLQQTKKGSRYTVNLNNGLRKVKGDVVFIVNADSYLQPDSLKELDKSFIKGSAGCGLRVYMNDEGFAGYDWRVPDGNKNIVKVNDIPQFYGLLTLNSAIIDRDILKTDLLDEEFKGYGRDDWEFFLRLGRKGVPLYQYNNVRIICEKEDPKPDNPDNINLFERRLNES